MDVGFPEKKPEISGNLISVFPQIGVRPDFHDVFPESWVGTRFFLQIKNYRISCSFFEEFSEFHATFMKHVELCVF